MPPRFVTASEMADRLRMTTDRLYQLVRAGEIPAKRIGERGRLLFDPAAVEAAMHPAQQPVPA